MNEKVGTSGSAAIGEIDVSTLHDILTRNPQAAVVDVRSLPEWMEARIPQVVRFVDFGRFALEFPALGLAKNETVYLICRTGNRSDYAARYLAGLGYKNVLNVLGGVVAWYQNGYPIASGPLPNANDDGRGQQSDG